MRRLLEVQPMMLDDPPMLADIIIRELQEYGRLELYLGTLPPGLVGFVSRTIDDEEAP